MAKIHKTLSPKVDPVTGKSEIMLRFIGGRLLMLRAKSGLFVKPAHWKVKEGEIRFSTLKTPEQKELIGLQKQMDDLCAFIFEEFAAIPDGLAGKDWLAKTVSKFHNPGKYKPKVKAGAEAVPATLLAHLADFCEKAPQRRDRKTGRLLARSSVVKYLATLGYIKEFARSQHRRITRSRRSTPDFTTLW